MVSLLNNNEKIFQLNEDDLLSSSSNVIQSYVDDNNNINSAIDDKLKSICMKSEERTGGVY